jgi:hypothetical protein
MIPMLIGYGLQAFGSIMGGQQQRKAMEYNAALMDQRAQAVAMAAETERDMMTDRARKTKAEQVAAYGKSGAMLTSGTPLTVLAEQSAEMQYDINQQMRNRLVEQQQLRSQADMMRYQGKQASRAGILGGAASGFIGVGKAFGD